MKPTRENGTSISEQVQAAVGSFQCCASEESRYRTIRIAVLVVLAMQNCSITMVTSYSRSVAGPKYLASTAVVANELLKTFIVMCQLFCNHGVKQVLLVVLPRHILSIRTMRYAIPALFYTVQNNLWFYAMDNLDSVTIAVTSQLKVLTTAVFSVIILNRRLSYVHWLALCVLVCGLIVMENDGDGREGTGGFYSGLLAMVAACSSSGFAGVYLELLFKNLDLDIWVANMQLQLFCLPVAVLGMLADMQDISGRGPLHGWDWITCIVVLLNALGGFLVSFTMKYADNILKTFAVSVSLVANCLVSSLALAVDLSPRTIAGVLLVILSTWLYSVGGRFLREEAPAARSTHGKEYLPVKAASTTGLDRVSSSSNLDSRGKVATPIGRGSAAHGNTSLIELRDVEAGSDGSDGLDQSLRSAIEKVFE